MTRLLMLLSLLLWIAPAGAEEIELYAAGSLHGALAAVAADYEKATGVKVKTVFGPSGLLTDRIESGEPYDLLASADMEHPLQLRKDGHAAAVVMFARNALCAFATPEAGLDADNFAARLLDPAVKLGTSTPKADPSGDYTWKMFGLIDKQRPGAAATLEAKADKVIGGAVPAASAGNPIASAFQRGEINVMIGYCSGAEQLKRDVAGLQVVRVPAPFAVGSDYGLAIRALDKPAALGLALAILSPEGQATLARYGFAPVGLPSAP